MHVAFSRNAGFGRRLCLLLAASAVCRPSAAKVCNVMHYGAVGDGKTLDTLAIAAAIKDCGSHGGGNVVIPGPGASGAPPPRPGPWAVSARDGANQYRFLSAPFNLTSNIRFSVESGATLLATTNATLWPVLPPLPSYGGCLENVGNMTGRYAAFIGGENMRNVTIDGGGTVDGQGLVWWQRSGRLPGHKMTLLHTRGRLVEPAYSQDVFVRDITLKDAPFWTLHLYACDWVVVERVTVTAPVWSRNTDCIDPDSSSNVLIRNCTLSGGDDQVAIKSGRDAAGRAFGRPSVNITVEDVHCRWGDGLSIGSEMSGGVLNVTFRRIKLGDVLHPMRIKSGYGRGGTVSNITFEDVQLASLGQLSGTAITVDEFDSNIPPNASHAKDGWPKIRDVSFRNVRGGALNAGVFQCIPEVPCTGITLDNVSIVSLKGFKCSLVSGTNVGTVKPSSCITAPTAGL